MTFTPIVQLVVVDDEPYICDIVVEALAGEDYAVVPFSDPLLALDYIADHPVDLVLTDLMMGDTSGLKIFDWTKMHHPDAIVLIMTAYPSIQTAIDVLREGAHDFLIKPFKLQVLRATISRALNHQRVVRDNLTLKAQVEFMRAVSAGEMSKTIDDYFRLVLTSCKVELGATACAVIEVDPESRQIMRQVYEADHEGDVAQVLNEVTVQQTLNSRTYQAAITTRRISRDGEDQTLIFISKPVMMDAKMYGVINLLIVSRFGRVTPGQMDCLTILANSTAAAIAKYHLYQDLRSSYLQAIRALANAIEARDPYTAGHTDRVLKLAELVARRLNWSPKQLEHLIVGCTLHDIGKIGVPDSVLNKVGRLTDEERTQMMKHPSVGLRIVSHIDLFVPAAPYIIAHHERYDGKGYPNGIKGEEIPIEGRLLSVVDTFDAIISDRPYRQGGTIAKAVEELVTHSGTQFDPKLVALFLDVLRSGEVKFVEWYGREFKLSEIAHLDLPALTPKAQA